MFCRVVLPAFVTKMKTIAAFFLVHFLFKQTFYISTNGNLIMEEIAQTLLEYYVSICERPKQEIQ